MGGLPFFIVNIFLISSFSNATNSVSAGSIHVLILHEGVVWSDGDNRPSPEQINDLPPITAIAAGL